VSIAVPAILTWARDLDATARRVRRLDEQSKIVAFWDSWLKIISATAPATKENTPKTEELIRVVTYEARRELADAGKKALWMYRLDEIRTHRRYPFRYAGFQRYRKTLPWISRALLLYRAPNPSARRAKISFYANLAVQYILFTIPSFWVNHIPQVQPSDFTPEHLRWLHSHPRLALSVLALFVLGLLTLVVVWVGMVIWMRHRSVMFENDRRYYIRDRLDLEQQS
jgi:hypothetical protein